MLLYSRMLGVQNTNNEWKCPNQEIKTKVTECYLNDKLHAVRLGSPTFGFLRSVLYSAGTEYQECEVLRMLHSIIHNTIARIIPYIFPYKPWLIFFCFVSMMISQQLFFTITKIPLWISNNESILLIKYSIDFYHFWSMQQCLC